MKDLFRAFQRISEKNRTIVYGLMGFITNLFYFVFKITVGILFKNPLLVAIALYNLLIGFVKALSSRGLLKNKDDIKDTKTYLTGGVLLAISSILYIIYISNQVGNPYHIEYTPVIAIVIATFSTCRIGLSINGLVKFKGRTLIIKQYKLTNFATALTNLVLTQMAILSFMPIPSMHTYNAVLGIIVGSVILACGLFITIHGLIRLRGFYKSKKEAEVADIV